MRRVKILLLLILAIISFSNPCLGQPDDEIQRLRNDLRQLTERVAAQEKRIANLEQYVDANGSSDKAPAAQDAQPIHGRTQSNQNPPLWHNPANWRKVAVGMTQQQVLVILDKPTSVGDYGNYVAYIYEGEVVGSGYVKGSVNFFGNRVGYGGIDVPVFLNR